MRASQDLIDSVATADNKVLAGGPDAYLNLAFGNPVAHQNSLNVTS